MDNNSISFKAINIANTKLKGHNIKLYKLSNKDNNFLEKLKQEIDIQKLMPQMTPKDSFIYEALVNRSIEKAESDNTQSVLISCDNIPCGVMSYTDKLKMIFVDHISTWPTKPNEKAPLACKIMFQNLFKEALNSNNKPIKLIATRFGSAISKYLSLGFKMYGGTDFDEIMKIHPEDIKKSSKALDEKFKLTETNETTEVNLFKEFNC